MKYKEISEMTDAALVEKLAELRREKLTLAIQARTGQLEKSARVREVRRSIARILMEEGRRVKANA